MTHNADVLIVGAGPAGIATAIAASLKGLSVAVADFRKPPIEKACGEGLLPEAVASLRSLGVDLGSGGGFPFTGIRFADRESSASARITNGSGFGMRRTALNEILIERARGLGVSFFWGVRVSEFDPDRVRVDGKRFSCKWLVGADGQNSSVREWANLNGRGVRLSRFGFSRHYAVTPWTDLVEIYWGDRGQMFVTPTGSQEICVAFLSHDPQLRIARALVDFPEVGERLRGARPLTSELGSVTALGSARAVVRGRVALVGDASFTVDGIAGQGLSLAFQQAIHLANAFTRDDLAYYEDAHQKAAKIPRRMTRLLLLMDQSAWIRRKALRLFTSKPSLFSKMMSIHMMSGFALEALKTKQILDLGWQVLRA